MANRVIKSRMPGGTVQLADTLASLFALELMAPRGRLYLIFPRLGDIPLLSSSFGQFRALMPELGQTELRLSGALSALARRGAAVRVMYRPGDAPTESFIGQLSSDVERLAVPRLEERELIGESFYLRGSLEFSLDGVATGEESVEVTTDPADVARALMEADQMWRRSS